MIINDIAKLIEESITKKAESVVKKEFSNAISLLGENKILKDLVITKPNQAFSLLGTGRFRTETQVLFHESKYLLDEITNYKAIRDRILKEELERFTKNFTKKALV